MRYLILTVTLLVSLSSMSQVMSIESLQKELSRQQDIFYDDPKFMMSGLSISSRFELKKGGKEFYYSDQPDYSPESNFIYPYSKVKDHYNFVAQLIWDRRGIRHIDVSSKGINYKIIMSFFSEIITKEKIVNFLKINKINNQKIYRDLNITESYNFGDINQIDRFVGLLWQIHFETSNTPDYDEEMESFWEPKEWMKPEPKFDENGVIRTDLTRWEYDYRTYNVPDAKLDEFLEKFPRAQQVPNTADAIRRIQIFPKDLEDIPLSNISDFPENVRKLSDFLRNELIAFARKESGKELPGEYYESQADTKVSDGDNIQAEKDYSKAIELYEKNGEEYANPNVYLKRGDIRIKLGNREGGIKDLEKGLEYYPSNPKAYNIYVRIAEAKIFIKKTYEAIFDCNKAIELKPNLPYAFGVRGVAKATINDVSGACADVKKAAELGNPEYEKMLGPICNRNE